MTDHIRIPSWVESLPAHGRYTFARQEAEKVSGGSFIAVQAALRRLKQKVRIASPRRGFFELVPSEYRVAGSLPPDWFIDDLMRYCGCHYYVALLSAARLHGAAHQAPMVFQVLTDKLNARMTAGRVVIEARKSRAVGRSPTTSIQTYTGAMIVSTPETTAFDLVRFPRASGSWNNVATVLTELAEEMDPAKLLEVAKLRPRSESQRLGYLLDFVGWRQMANPLAEWLSHSMRLSVLPFRADRSTDGHDIDLRWRLIPNEEIDPDL